MTERQKAFIMGMMFGMDITMKDPVRGLMIGARLSAGDEPTEEWIEGFKPWAIEAVNECLEATDPGRN